MQIKYENIILRDMIESDIEDHIRWMFSETEWRNWDAPWRKTESDEGAVRRRWTEYYDSVKELPDDVRRPKFEIEWNGRHIGWVSSYPIMGAFTDWLISTYGIERYMEMYKQQNMAEAIPLVYQKTPEELNKEFVAYVQLFAIDEMLEQRMESLLNA